MQAINLKRINIYRFDVLSEYQGVKHFITTRNPLEKLDFNICLWAVEEILPVIENRKILSSELDIPLSRFVFQQQMHTGNVSTVGHFDRGRGVNEYTTALKDNDAMITNEKGICIVVIGGDCVPILFYDPVREVIGAVHSGWRGTAKRIAEQTVAKMCELYNCRPTDIVAGIGPSIGPESYEVDEVVLEAFKKTYKNTSIIFKPKPTPGKYLLDLWKANQIQLVEAGLNEKNIEISGLCTYKNNDEFFSARRGDLGRFGCGIMLI